MKLDTCGVKLKLHHWYEFTQQERQALVEMPCTTQAEIDDYRDYLQNLVIQHTGELAQELAVDPHPPWQNAAVIPTNVLEKSQGFNVEITQATWEGLSPLQRFALIKLSRPSHENKNFLPALKEFELTGVA